MVLFASLLAGLALAASAPDMPDPPTIQIRLSPIYIDGVRGRVISDEQPELARKPSPADLHGLPTDTPSLALTFNCAATTSGRLRDCRGLYATSGGPDVAKNLTKIISPLVRVSGATARTMRAKAYRLTVSVAVDRLGLANSPCLPPSCWIEGAMAPPPPEPAHNPILASALAQGTTCSSLAGRTASRLRRAAETAMQTRGAAPAREADQAQLRDYVLARQAYMACVDGLRVTAAALPLDMHDRGLADRWLKAGRASYFRESATEMAILIGVIDKDAAATERSYGYPD
jgi:hypothetical protein